jgi:hypothetical protein
VLDLLVSDQYADLNDTDTAGSSLAYQLSRQAPDKSICVLEAKDVASGASKVSRLPLLVNLMLQVVAMVGISPLMHPQLSPTSPHHSKKAELAYMPKQPLKLYITSWPTFGMLPKSSSEKDGQWICGKAKDSKVGPHANS